MDLFGLAIPGIAAAGLGMAAATLMAPTAVAQSAACMMHKDLMSYLGSKFEEKPHALGLVANQSIMQVLVSQNGTWTIVMTTTQGLSCIVAAGDSWEDVRRTVAVGPEY